MTHATPQHPVRGTPVWVGVHTSHFGEEIDYVLVFVEQADAERWCAEDPLVRAVYQAVIE